MRIFGPLLGFEIIASARRVRFYVLRGVLVALLGVMLYICYLAMITPSQSRGSPSIQASARMADTYFTSFGFFQLAAVMLLTPSLLAPAVAAEKERRTIDYLLTSRLSSHEIVFGKWFARVLTATTPIIAGLGLLGILLLFGGVDPQSLGTLTVITFCAIASTAAIAMLVSTYSKRTRDALMTSFFLIAVVYSLPYLVRGAVGATYFFADRWKLYTFTEVQWRDMDSRIADWSRREPITLFYHLQVLGLAGPNGPQGDLKTLCIVHGSVALASLILAALSLRRRYRFETSGPHRKGVWRFPRLRIWPRVRLGWLPPVFWKEWFVTRSSGFVISTILLAAIHIPMLAVLSDFWLARLTPTRNFEQEFALSFGLVVIGIAAWTWMVVLVRAATSVTQERTQDTWTMLLASGLSSFDIILGKALGAIRPAVSAAIAFVPSVIVVVIIAPFSFTCILFAYAVIFALSIFFSGLGVSQSLARKKGTGAIGVCFGVFFIMHGVIQLLGSLLLLALMLAIGGSFADRENVLLHILVESIPLVLAEGAGLLGTPATLTTRANESVAVLVGLGWVAVYAALGGWFIVSSCLEFTALSGRTEHVLPLPPVHSEPESTSSRNDVAGLEDCERASTLQVS